MATAEVERFLRGLEAGSPLELDLEDGTTIIGELRRVEEKAVVLRASADQDRDVDLEEVVEALLVVTKAPPPAST